MSFSGSLRDRHWQQYRTHLGIFLLLVGFGLDPRIFITEVVGSLGRSHGAMLGDLVQVPSGAIGGCSSGGGSGVISGSGFYACPKLSPPGKEAQRTRTYLNLVIGEINTAVPDLEFQFCMTEAGSS